jgi:hypothetical protein
MAKEPVLEIATLKGRVLKFVRQRLQIFGAGSLENLRNPFDPLKGVGVFEDLAKRGVRGQRLSDPAHDVPRGCRVRSRSLTRLII